MAKPQAKRPTPDPSGLALSLSKLATHRRDLILEAIATSAKELLRSGDLGQSIPKVLEALGRATAVDQVHMLVFNPGAVAQIGDHFHWNGPGFTGGDPPAVESQYEEAGLAFASWLPALTRGEAIAGNAADFEDSARLYLERHGVRSTAAVPVLVDGGWLGLLAFDVCHEDRRWLPSEIDAIKILAELLGAAVARAKRQQALVDANRIIESSPVVLYRLGPAYPFPLTYLSENIRQYGYEAADLLASPYAWAAIVDAKAIATTVTNINAMVAGTMEYSREDFGIRRPDGTELWFDGESRAVRNADGRLIAVEGVLTDITERRRLSERFATLAHTDSLTDLPNRAAFLERLELAFARARRGALGFAVLYLDLDHFKDVNDTLGHPVGDAFLQAVAGRLKASARATDLVARFGGDEFAILLEDIDEPAIAAAFAEKIRVAISAPFAIGSNQVNTTASIGIVLHDASLDGSEAMLTRADLALYRAKNEGRNQFRFYADDLDRRAQDRMTIGADLHGAAGRNEFELYYQPQVELASGAIVGLEALLRWHHPSRGLVLPETFIPVAESNGTILEIGKWVIEQGCRQIGLWRAQGIAPATLAVNVSAVQFQVEGDLDRIVVAALERFDVPAAQLELELTESALMETAQRHRGAFDRLRRVGVRLAVDDFGTGFSSLAYLTSFRVARLKLASQFIEMAVTSPGDEAIVRATVSLARELGIELLAEGISTAQQRDLLISTGCALAQGFLLGAPMPESEVAKLLPKRTPGPANLPKGQPAAGP